MSRTVENAQGSFEFVGWGGRREGAGRPKKSGATLRHAERSSLASRFPVHATLRAVPGMPNLRRAAAFRVIIEALRAVRERNDFRVVHFSVQTNHLHLLVEAASARALSRGMQGLAIRIARGVNRISGRSGKVWRERYHARVLRSPREVRQALCYVLQNTRRHVTTERERLDPDWIDPCSSGPVFDGWRGRVSTDVDEAARVTSPARTWLLSTGWRRCGLIRIDEVPAAAMR